MELHNIDPYIHTQLYKLASSGLCSGVDGQMMMSLMVRPPLPDEDSYELFNKEETAIFESLKRRAVSVSIFATQHINTSFSVMSLKTTKPWSSSRAHTQLVDGLNAIDGITCQPSEGAMYAFPRVELPSKALDAAAEQEQTPDTLYALSLLEETGICVVPASGFGQKG